MPCTTSGGPEAPSGSGTLAVLLLFTIPLIILPQYSLLSHGLLRPPFCLNTPRCLPGALLGLGDEGLSLLLTGC